MKSVVYPASIHTLEAWQQELNSIEVKIVETSASVFIIVSNISDRLKNALSVKIRDSFLRFSISENFDEAMGYISDHKALQSLDGLSRIICLPDNVKLKQERIFNEQEFYFIQIPKMEAEHIDFY